MWTQSFFWGFLKTYKGLVTLVKVSISLRLRVQLVVVRAGANPLQNFDSFLGKSNLCCFYWYCWHRIWGQKGLIPLNGAKLSGATLKIEIKFNRYFMDTFNPLNKLLWNCNLAALAVDLDNLCQQRWQPSPVQIFGRINYFMHTFQDYIFLMIPTKLFNICLLIWNW